MAGPKHFPRWLLTKYRREGGRYLLKKLPSFLYWHLFQGPVELFGTELAWHRIKRRVIAREELCERGLSGGRIEEYGPSEEFVVKVDTDGPLPPSLTEATGPVRRNKSFVIELRNPTLLWEGGPVLTSNGDIVLETVENDREILRSRIRHAIRKRSLQCVLRDLNPDPRPRSTRYDGAPIFLLTRHPKTMFYHWVTEYLPKLRGLDVWSERTGESPKVLIEPDPPDWVRESLALLGYDSGQLLHWNEDYAIIRRLLVPEHRSSDRHGHNGPSRSDCEYLRREAMKRLEVPKDLPKRLLISRNQAEDRRIVNESEVRSRLKEYGFESVILEGMPFEDQVRLFAGAEIVVAPHGAGLSHLLFADDLTVVELFPENDIRDQFFYLSGILGHDYHWLTGTQHGVDFSVDVAQLVQVLEPILS